MFQSVYAPRNLADEYSAHIVDCNEASIDSSSTKGGENSSEADGAPIKHVDKVGKHDHKNDNIFESFNNTQRACYRPRHGIKGTLSPIFADFRIWHNFARRHSSIGYTQAEAARITVHGGDKWRTLIGNASMTALGMQLREQIRHVM